MKASPGSSPRVSILIPAYNTANFIGDTLTSVFNQTYTDFEVIVINDGSPDTPEMERAIAPWRDRICYIEVPNGGCGSARNQGMQIARGDLVAILDSDDLWEPHYLEVQVGFLDRHPEADIVYANAVVFGDCPSAGKRMMDLSPSRGEVTFEAVVREECCVLISVLARKAALERVGRFDATLRRCEDFDMWLRCLNEGSKIIYHDQVLFRYRRRNDSLSANAIQMNENAAFVLQKLRRTLTLTPERARVVDDRILLLQNRALLFRAKQALLRREYKEAILHLTTANTYYRHLGITALVMLLRVAPSLVPVLQKLRSSLFFRTPILPLS